MTDSERSTHGKGGSVVEQLVDLHWRKIYNFAFRLTLSREDATSITEETFLRTYVGQAKLPKDGDIEPWLLRIAAHVAEKKMAKGQDVSFEMLDETLRSEATRTDVHRSITDPHKDFMLWELKQGCMTSVVNCLSPGERVAFVMSVMMGLPEEDAAKALGITASAYKVRLSRARKKVTDYLAPRCEHVDPSNPCHCPSRLGIALSKGFIAQPLISEVSLRNRAPYGRYGAATGAEDVPARDVMRIYQTLPEVDAPEELRDKMLGLIASGEWETTRKQAEKR